MKLKAMSVTNYGTFFGTHEFVLGARGLVLVLGENLDEPRMNSNGAGKSTIFDALDWCLYGRVPRNDHVDSIINEEAGKECTVRTTFADDTGPDIVVSRWRKVERKHGLSVEVGGRDVSSLDVAETQRTIERHLGADRSVFHAAVLFGQTDLWKFADATDAEQMEILTKILQLHQIDEWLELAKGKRRHNDGEMQRANQMCRSLVSKLEGMRATDYGALVARWDEAQQEKIQGMRGEVQRVEELVAHRTAAAGQLPLYQRQLADLQAQTPQSPDLGAFRQEMTRLWQAHGAAQSDAKVTETKVTAMRQELERIRQVGVGRCSQCGQTVTEEHLAQETARIQPQIGGMELIYQTQVATAEEIKGRVRVQDEQMRRSESDFQGLLQVHSAQCSQVQKELAVAEAAQREVTHMGQALARAQQALQREEMEANPFRAQMQQLAATITQREKELAQVTEAHQLLEEADRYYAFWVEAFGPKGLKSYILDTKLEEMTTAANRWVQLLTGGTVWIRFETQTLGRSTKTLSNRLNIRVFRWNPSGEISERNYRSWSGGERQRVSLGVDLGLASLIAARATKKWDVLIFDEVFRHLDQSGREAVVEMLHQLRREKSSLFVVDHDAEFQGSFENRVWVRKQQGRSTIQEENGHGQQADEHRDAGAVDTPKPEAARKRRRLPTVPAPGRKRKRRPTIPG